LILDVLKAHGDGALSWHCREAGKPTGVRRHRRQAGIRHAGYPTSCLSNAYLLAGAFVRRVARLPEWRPVTVDAPLARRIVSTTGRHQFYTVKLVDGRAEPAFKASGDITSMANADGYIEIAAQTDVVEAGTTGDGETLLK
jgi:molybdopterin biosynthesis enzyme